MLNSRFASLSLLALCILLATIISDQIQAPLNQGNKILLSANENIELEELTTYKIFSMNSINTFDEVITRPLFSDTRRPKVIVEIDKPEVELIAAKKPDLTLLGVVISNEENIVFVQVSNNEKLKRLKLGESIEGWELTKIKPTSIKLKLGLEYVVYELNNKKGNINVVNKQHTRNRSLFPNKKPSPSMESLMPHNINQPPNIPAIPMEQFKTPSM